MTNLGNYFNDGANYQAKAVLAFLDYFNVEESWNSKRKKYDAEINVARWENCREQGYILSLTTKNMAKQLNIAFFEHRNSDNICAVMWEQRSVNTLTIDSANFGNAYETKWDVSFSVNYGEVVKMSEWIEKQFTEFWINNHES